MIQGQPRLITWSLDDIMRCFELGEAGFGQLWSTGFAQDASAVAEGIYPHAFYFESNDVLATARALSNSTAERRSMNAATGTQIGTLGYGNGTDEGAVIGAFDRALNAHILWPYGSVSGQNNNLRIYSDAGDITTGESVLNSVQRYTVTISPDSELLFLGYISGNSHLYAVGSYGAPLQSLTGFAYPVRHAIWSPDSRYLMAIPREAGAPLAVFRRDETDELVAAGSIPAGEYGEPYNVAFSSDNRHVAVSFHADDVFTTVIYGRFGDVFVPGQVIGVPMGRLLDFTRDGLMLIDANAKRVFVNNAGTFEEEAGLLSALPSNVMAQTISDHVEQIVSTAAFYADALVAFAMGDVVLSNLKLVLLSNEATFDGADATISDVTGAGAYEVHGEGWPEGGVALTNAALVAHSASRAAITADTIETIIYGSGMTFRRATIVEGDTPRIWIDFGKAITIVPDQQLSFDMSTLGIVAYSN